MPVPTRRDGQDAWLTEKSGVALFQPAPNDLLRLWPVPKLVNALGRGVSQFELPQWVEAVCKRDPLMLLGLGATFERSPGRRLGPHRLQERLDAEDFDHSFQVVGQNVKAHLRFDLF